MKLEINVSYKRVVNLGDYESVHIQAGITEEIENEDARNYEEIFADLFDECEHFVLKKCEEEVAEPNDKIELTEELPSNVPDDDDIPF